MLSFSHLTRANGGSSGTVYNTASISPTAGRLVVVAVLGSSGTPGAFSSCSGAGITWTRIFNKQATVIGSRWVTIFVGTATGSSGSLTLTSSTNQGDAYWTIFQVASDQGVTPQVVDTNVAANDSAGSHAGLTVTLSSFANPTNFAAGVFFWGQATTITPGSGFTTINEGQSSIRMLSEYKQNDNTVDASWSSANNWSMAFAMELTDVSSSGAFLSLI